MYPGGGVSAPSVLVLSPPDIRTGPYFFSTKNFQKWYLYCGTFETGTYYAAGADFFGEGAKCGLRYDKKNGINKGQSKQSAIKVQQFYFRAPFWLHLGGYAILCTLPLLLSSFYALVIRAAGSPFFASISLHARNWYLYGGLFELVLISAWP